MHNRWLLALLIPASLAAQSYSGAAACTACHPSEVATQAKSHHAAALRPMPGSPLAETLLKASGQIHYTPAPDGVVAQAGPERALLTWAFGAGAQGITPVGTLLGTALEYRFSAYPPSNTLDLTFGHPPQATSLGILQDNRTIHRCFSCHSITPADGPLKPIELGVQCERCHGPGAAHIQAAQSHAPPAQIRQSVFNAARLPAKAQVEVCGACHRLPTPDSGDEPELEDPISIRFAPIGLMASRCFRDSQSLSCLTCHNPHENARPASDLAYRDKCLTCHVSQANVQHCRRVQKENCLTCHMQKTSLSPHLTFTDHRIRVYQ